MKTVKYWLTGTRQPNLKAEGTPNDLLAWIMGFPPSKDIPPLSVLNDVFRKGFRSGGFNGDTHWEPFELTPSEYEVLVREWLSDESAGRTMLEAPAWVENELDWKAYVGWHRHGVPLEEYRALLYRFDALIAEQQAARGDGRRFAVARANVRLAAVARQLMRLLAKHGS